MLSTVGTSGDLSAIPHARMVRYIIRRHYQHVLTLEQQDDVFQECVLNLIPRWKRKQFDQYLNGMSAQYTCIRRMIKHYINKEYGYDRRQVRFAKMYAKTWEERTRRSSNDFDFINEMDWLKWIMDQVQSPYHKQILSGIVQGKSSEELAQEMQCTGSNIRKHLKHLRVWMVEKIKAAG